MCITMATAELKGTLLYAGEGRFDSRYVHVLAYQNTARSAFPNAMILPIPAAAPLDHRNAIDTRQFPDFLKKIQAANAPARAIGRGGDGARGRSPAQVFDVGSYTVVLAGDARSISAALDRVPPQKRPPDNAELFAAFEQLYPGWPLAVCCWQGTIRPEPLLWWYEPLEPDWLFAPALDAHDGGPPRLGEQVEVDHFLAFGSSSYEGGNAVAPIRAAPRETQKLFPRSVHGTRIREKMPNGDFWLAASDLSGPAIRRAPGKGSAAIAVALEGWSYHADDFEADPFGQLEPPRGFSFPGA